MYFHVTNIKPCYGQLVAESYPATLEIFYQAFDLIVIKGTVGPWQRYALY